METFFGGGLGEEESTLYKLYASSLGAINHSTLRWLRIHQQEAYGNFLLQKLAAKKCIYISGDVLGFVSARLQCTLCLCY